MMRIRRVVLWTTLAIASLSTPPACKNTPTDGFQLEVPGDVAAKIAWYEIGIFSGVACSTLGPQLEGGVPVDGYVQRLAYAAGQSSPPGIPNIPRAKYAIGVAGRAADCSVLAAGCSDVDLSSVSSVVVALNDVNPPRGACTGGATCDLARCTAGSSAGAGCSLELVGAGPFADPLSFEATEVSAPGLAATPSGFLLGYREFDPASGQARVTAIPIDASGGAGPAVQVAQTACLGGATTDASGLVFTGGAGTLAAARAPCGADAGIDLFGLDATGALGKPAFADLGPATVTLSTSHALAASSAAAFLAYTQGGTSYVATVNGSVLGAATSFGESAAVDSWVAASDSLVALLSAGGGAAPPPLVDAGGGDDGSLEGGGDDSSVDAAPDTALPGPAPGTATLGVVVLPASGAGSPIASVGAPFEFAGRWGSVAAQAGRVFVVSDGASPDKPVAYRAFDLGTASPSVVDGFTTSGLGALAYSDVAFHQDHVFFAVERDGSISLVAYDHATTTPTPLRQIALDGDPRVPSVASVRDGRVAVLATDTRVVVAWSTAKALSTNDAAGGYAVFACTTP